MNPILLQPFGVSYLKFEFVSMIFIVGLPNPINYIDIILVAEGRLTKIAHFIPTYITMIAYEIVELIMRDIFGHLIIDYEIISDRDHKFMSETIFILCGTKIKLSIAYHHGTDGQIKHTKIILEDIVQISVGK